MSEPFRVKAFFVLLLTFISLAVGAGIAFDTHMKGLSVVLALLSLWFLCWTEKIGHANKPEDRK